MNGEFTAKDSKMILYLNFAKSLATRFTTFSIKQIPRDRNAQADALANLLGSALRKSKFSSTTLIHLLAPAINTNNQTSKPIYLDSAKLEPNSSKVLEPDSPKPIKDKPTEPNIITPIANQTSWIQTIFDYLEQDTLPENKVEARALRFKASKYTIIQGVLFKKLTRDILQRYIEEDMYEQILKDFHDGECGAHSGGRTLANRILTYDYYWPTLRNDAQVSRYGLLTPKRNNEELSRDLDTIKERRDLAYIRMATYQQMVARSFNKNVKARIYKVGDWVLRKVFQNTRELNAGKLGATWEGPYQIDRVVSKGAYRLATPDGKLVPRSWNAAHLKPYHL
uniref:Reverse transcriptase domain-containing protein n=1 Tax=Chenopodium quinoa TaxID=63459 RepID=A0A803L268_CHEQI